MFSGRICIGAWSRALLLCLSAWALVGCGTTKELPEYQGSSPGAENARRRPLRPSTVGKVSLVNQDDKFVLIELQSNRVPSAGTPLQAFSGQMRSATLKVSKERKPPFLIADIVSGTPLQNDVVMLTGKGGPAKPGRTSGGGGGGSDEDVMGDAGPAPELELLPAEDDGSFPDQSEMLDAGEGGVNLPAGNAPMLDPLPPLEPSPAAP